jgi:rubredoxin
MKKVPFLKGKSRQQAMSMKRNYVCIVCDYSFDAGSETLGDTGNTKDLFKQLPPEWKCPECGAGKSCFVTVDTVREKEEVCK